MSCPPIGRAPMDASGCACTIACIPMRSAAARSSCASSKRCSHRSGRCRWAAAGQFNLGHVCGTCRFGTDPATSVLNAQNRAHEVANLYVVDTSFFPSSAGLNPSLTVAANALRVAQCVDSEHFAD